MAGYNSDEQNRSKAPGPRPFTGRNPNNVEDSRRPLPISKKKKPKKKLSSLQMAAQRRMGM